MKNAKAVKKTAKVRTAVVVWMKPSLKAKLQARARKAEKSLSAVIRDTMTATFS